MGDLAEVYTRRENFVKAVWVMPFTVDWVVDQFLTQSEKVTVAYKRSRLDPELIIEGKPCVFGNYLVRDNHGILTVMEEDEFKDHYEKFYTADDMAKVITGMEGIRPGDIRTLMENYKIPVSVLITAINEYIDTDGCKMRRISDGYTL